MNQEGQQEQSIVQAEEYSKNTTKKKKAGFGKGFLAGVIFMIAVFAVIIVVGNRLTVQSTTDAVLDDDTEEKIETLASYIQETYYEDVDVEDLLNGLYAGLFDNLDVYSQYYTAEEYQELYESSVSGTYCGIGASLQQDEATKAVTIVHVYDDSPAQEAGLLADDIILSADGYDASEMDLTEFVSHIRGEEGTTVHLTVYRAGESEELEFDIVRRSLSLPTVSSDMIGTTGYIQVTEFTDATPEQFSNALESLKSQNMESLIVDLRSNPGGMLTAVCDMLDEILPEGLIVYTEDKAGERVEYNSTDDKSLDLPLVVLVDGNSASASEIFAGAIQDRNAGTIVGTTTYGKGVVQTIRSLPDGSAFKLTTNKYFTPGGTCIQGIGIEPDVEVEYEFLGGEDDAYSYEFDSQIQKALEVLQ
jgi:carboxyl-terminal processing protease